MGRGPGEPYRSGKFPSADCINGGGGSTVQNPRRGAVLLNSTSTAKRYCAKFCSVGPDAGERCGRPTRGGELVY